MIVTFSNVIIKAFSEVTQTSMVFVDMQLSVEW